MWVEKMVKKTLLRDVERERGVGSTLHSPQTCLKKWPVQVKRKKTDCSVWSPCGINWRSGKSCLGKDMGFPANVSMSWDVVGGEGEAVPF